MPGGDRCRWLFSLTPGRVPLPRSPALRASPSGLWPEHRRSRFDQAGAGAVAPGEEAKQRKRGGGRAPATLRERRPWCASGGCSCRPDSARVVWPRRPRPARKGLPVAGRGHAVAIDPRRVQRPRVGLVGKPGGMCRGWRSQGEAPGAWRSQGPARRRVGPRQPGPEGAHF